MRPARDLCVFYGKYQTFCKLAQTQASTFYDCNTVALYLNVKHPPTPLSWKSRNSGPFSQEILRHTIPVGIQASEAAAIGADIAKVDAPKAKAAQKAAGARGKEGGRSKKKTPGASYPKGKRDESTRTNRQASRAVGMSRRNV